MPYVLLSTASAPGHAVVEQPPAVTREPRTRFIEVRRVGDPVPVRSVGAHLEQVPVVPIGLGAEHDPAAIMEFLRELSRIVAILASLRTLLRYSGVSALTQVRSTSSTVPIRRAV